VTSTEVDVVVVGAGIIGLASAWQLTGRRPALRTVLLDKEPQLAAHQTGRNSGVLHSGIYYRPGSLKARTAVTGRTSMVRFCVERGIPHEVCGKVIVATRDDELGRMHDLFERAGQNGVKAELIDRDRLLELEPHCAGIAGIHVPETGICDFTAVCRTLAGDLAARGVEIRLGTQVTAIEDRPGEVVVSTPGGEIRARLLVNCAGLHSDRVAAQLPGVDLDAHIVPFRGEYYELVPDKSYLVENLIYPVPDPSFPFLGVHLTRMIGGHIHAGPNAVLALDREGYRWRDVSLAQLREHATDRGLWHLARRYWRTGAGEVWRSLNKQAFVRALQRLVPDVQAEDLAPSPAGVRAQAMTSTGELLDDFAIGYTPHSVHILNAPSPAATASLEIGATVADTVEERLAG
jgi:L-2-hydroxyglutarate oxidase